MTRPLPFSTLLPATNRMMQLSYVLALPAIRFECAAKTATISAIPPTAQPLATIPANGPARKTANHPAISSTISRNPPPTPTTRHAIHHTPGKKSANLPARFRQDSGNDSLVRQVRQREPGATRSRTTSPLSPLATRSSLTSRQHRQEFRQDSGNSSGSVPRYRYEWQT